MLHFTDNIIDITSLQTKSKCTLTFNSCSQEKQSLVNTKCLERASVSHSLPPERSLSLFSRENAEISLACRH
jgi:hypothetical protein